MPHIDTSTKVIPIEHFLFSYGICIYQFVLEGEKERSRRGFYGEGNHYTNNDYIGHYFYEL